MTRRTLTASPSVLRSLAAVAMLSSLLTGCGEEPASTTAEPAADVVTARTYSVRGIVEQLPDAEQAGVPFLIRHEAIPDFVNVYGQQTGMDAMTMPFEVSDDVSLDTLVVGDPIAFDLAVDWEGSPAMAITAIEKLPAETELVLADE